MALGGVTCRFSLSLFHLVCYFKGNLSGVIYSPVKED